MGSTASKTNEHVTSTECVQSNDLDVDCFQCPVITLDEGQERGVFSNIPKELIYELSHHLSDKDLLSFSSTCRSLHRFVSVDFFWNRIIHQRTFIHDDEFTVDKFPKIKYWYFFQKNKLDIKLIPNPQDAPKTSIFFQGSKVIVAGCCKTGKTQLCHALCGEPFEGTYKHTPGTELKRCTVQLKGSTTQRWQIWDTTGSQIFRAHITVVYKGSSIVLLVYSVANSNSFKDLEQFYAEAARFPSEKSFIVVANCIDEPKQNWQVNKTEGQEWTEKHKALFVEMSAKNRQGLYMLRKKIWNAIERLDVIVTTAFMKAVD